MHNYRIKTVYGMARHLKNEGMLSRIPLRFLRDHHVGYTLTAKGAKAAARLCGDEEQFRPKEWMDDPVQLEHFYGVNAFFTSLIRHSLPQKDEGLIEWLGSREATDRYVQIKASGRKSRPVKPDGFGIYRCSGRGRLVFHLEYDTGTENLWRLKEKMIAYGELLPAMWPQVEAVHVLFVTKIASRPKALLDIWDVLRVETLSAGRLPGVWAIHESEWNAHGAQRALWRGAGGQNIRWMDMPLLPLSSDSGLPVWGKQPREPSPTYRR